MWLHKALLFVADCMPSLSLCTTRLNNPNILASSVKSPATTPTTASRRIQMQTKRVLKTASQPINLKPEHQEKSETRKPKHCPYHDQDGHSLEKCVAFSTMTLEEKTEWIFKAALCYRCLSKGHRANRCKQKIECSIRKDHHQTAFLHKERPVDSVEVGQTIGAKCTSTCKAIEGGVSFSKLLLVEVHRKERPNVIHRRTEQLIPY